MDDARGELVSQVERAVRRGEFAEALALLDPWLAAHPGDAALQAKRELVAEMSGPVRRPSTAERLEPSREGRAEQLASEGRFEEATALYAELVRERPDAALVRERWLELRRLVPQPAVAPPPAAVPENAPKGLPADPVARLQELLERLGAHRR